jgi:hypothetical protein
MGWVGPAMQLGGAVLGGLSGGKSGGSGVPGYLRKTGKAGSNLLRDAAARPADQSIAQLTPDQLASYEAVRAAQGLGAQDMVGAQDTAKGLAGGIGAADVAKFYSPYQSDVIDAALADIEAMRGRRQNQATADAHAAGAFGGGREGVYRANIDGEYDRTSASTIANLRNTGFTNAAQLATQNHGLQVSGNQQLMDMIDARRQAAYGDAEALNAAGGQQFARAQSVLDYPITLGEKMMGVSSGAGAPAGGGGGGFTGALQGAIGGLQFGRDIYNAGKDIDWGWGYKKTSTVPRSGPVY